MERRPEGPSGNVIPFERSAAFMHRRALKKRDENHLLDALDLLRRALERTPDHPEYQIDLAETYYEMGCFEESNRRLARLLAREDAPSECYFGLGCNYFSLEDESSARYALLSYLKRAPHGEYRPDVLELLGELGGSAPASRKARRAAYLSARGLTLMEGGDYARARPLLRKSLRLVPRQVEVRAMLALCLMGLGERAYALHEIYLATQSEARSVRVLLVAAQLYHKNGYQVRAQQALSEADQLAATPEELAQLAHAACLMKLDEQALLYIKRALQEAPFDRQLLHAMAVALINTGRPVDSALHYWRRIRRIDPEDSVAGCFLRLAAQGALPPAPLSYAYAVPPEEFERRLVYLTGVLEGGVAALTRLWDQDPQLSMVLKWALSLPMSERFRPVVTLVGAIERPETALMLRDLLMRPDVPEPVKQQAVMFLKLRGEREPFPVLTGAGFREIHVGVTGPARLPLSHRRMLEQAVLVGSRYGDLAEPMLRIWSQFALRRGKTPPIRRFAGWIGALIACALEREGRPHSRAQIARLAGCSLRRLNYCLAQLGQPTEEENP